MKELVFKYHTNGDVTDYMVLVELAEIWEALRLEREALETTSYMSFFKIKGNRHRFFIILAVGFFSKWSGNGLISLLSHSHSRFDRIYIPGDPDTHQRAAYDLEPGHDIVLFVPGQPIWTPSHVLDFHDRNVDHIHQ